MITDLSATNSIVSEWVSELRNATIQTDSMRFRKNVERVGEIAAYEISKTMTYHAISVQTPLGTAACTALDSQPIVATILRAGLPLYQGILNIFDKAGSAFIGSSRKHAADGTFVINQQYMASPELAKKTLIVADSMLATGASIVAALDELLEHDTPASLHIVAVIGCTPGIEFVLKHFPEAHIWCGAIDSELKPNTGYIVPGLGDAGDLAFGAKRQY